MSKFSTLNYLINSYYAGKKEVEIFHLNDSVESDDDFNLSGFEPSQSSIDAILNFASQLEVLRSGNIGNIELNLN
ncbi:hypothetical protein AQPE_3632 [Aquipluma nitroreducens]|uniref:Uncharacterized protein n=1 Tax=Aquipluma nitroreducens TaxID=2010828 RepID=A0A5K7SDB8_9BACT|nr:hypothetical protein [Aquipluma nitroreducens]BBE19447.1 hypothetical protein AQPE_3632 [Aquipluma nitroreducens]